MIARRAATFTFHYASTLSDAVNIVEFIKLIIYIPLCFYFILQALWWSRVQMEFTFHYASTLSCAAPEV